MAEGAGERTEKPTDKRMREARKRGQIPRSQDLVGAASVLVLVMVLPGALSRGSEALVRGIGASMRSASLEPTDGNVLRAAGAVAAPVAAPFLLLAGAAMGAGLAANLAQVGLNLSPEGLIPKFARIDPFQGVKRVLGKQGLFECAKALFKSLVFAGLAASVLSAHWGEILMLGALPVGAAMGVVGNVAHAMLVRLGMAWLVLAAADYAFQRKRTMSELMMTKEEVRQEMKEAETNPELKAARMRRARALSKSRTASAVRTADVIVTNPTHYAVAIKYEGDKSHAPVVVAKGTDHLAARIREIAAEAKVPVVPNPPLARALYRQCEIGDFVPRDLFAPVAEILAYVYRTLKKA